MNTELQISLSNPQLVGSYSFYWQTPSNSWAVRYSYVADLNGDRIDEVIFAGFETQPNTPLEYDNTQLLIFGWQNNQLVNKNHLWFPDNIDHVEGVGDLKFGDFNGDGLVDFFTSAYTDMSHPVQAYAFLNKGDHFERVALGSDQWQHGAAVYDFNRDGFDDIVAVGWGQPRVYVGSSSGLSRYDASASLFGSGIAVGDFLGDGSVSAVVTDWSPANGPQDIALIKLTPNFNGLNPGSQLESEFVSLLPTPQLGSASHDIRSEALDFTGDGLLDVIVFSYKFGHLGGDISRVQFYANSGNGVFEDVTAQRLIGYDTSGVSTYTPVIRDFNRDGSLDIFMLDANWNFANSTRFLMGTADGRFVESGREYLSSQIPMTSVATVAKGPDGKFHLVWDAGSNGLASIYSAPLSFEINQEESASAPAPAPAPGGGGGGGGFISAPVPSTTVSPPGRQEPVENNFSTKTPDIESFSMSARSAKKSVGFVITEGDVIDLSGLAENLEQDLWWSARAPKKKVDATGAVWFKKGVLHVSTDADGKAELFAKIVGVKAIDADDVILG